MKPTFSIFNSFQTSTFKTSRLGLPPRLGAALLALLIAGSFCSVGHAQEPTEAPGEKQLKLIDILHSNAAPGEKGIACKQLAVYGTKDAVPALAPLILDPELASWARIALEAIPDPAADDALRKALDSLKGRLLVGTINSIAVRRDQKAVDSLTRLLKNEDPDVVSAAAAALGRIGGPNSAKALTTALASASSATRSGIAQGCILCGEGFLAQHKSSDAQKLYDTVRAASLPKQRILEATRGAILARGTAGLPLLLEQLRSPDKAIVGLGLSTARELPGREVTQGLADELDRCAPDLQSRLLLALADRSDPAATPAIVKAAKNGPVKTRIVAVGILDRMGDVSSAPVLLDAAADNDAELAQAAMTALARLPGNKVDSDLLTQLPQSSGKMRQALIELASQRRIESALPEIVRSANDQNPGVRSAAIQAIGVLGQEKQVPDLVRLLNGTSNAKERSDLEIALVALSGRSGGTSTAALSPLMKSDDSALRIIRLHALATAGGEEALSAVKAAVTDKDEDVQDEAVRTLSTWPNNWPEDSAVAEPLLALAKSGKKTSHCVLGLRGYLQFVKGDKKLNDNDKVAKLVEALPLIKRPEEQRLAIAVLDAIPTDGSLELLTGFAKYPAVADDACSSIVNLASKHVGSVTPDQRRKSLEVVVEKCSPNVTRKKAETMLKGT